MAVSNPVKSRMTWPQIRQSSDYKGRWVALDHCRYDSRTAQPVEGVVVDVDEDLVELCSRIQESDNKHCAILFCGMTTEAMTKHGCTPGSTPVSGVGEGVSLSQSFIFKVRFGKMPKPTDGTSVLPGPEILGNRHLQSRP